MADRLIVDLNRDGTARMSVQLDGDDLADGTAPFGLTWPLDGQALDDLRFYLEDYLRLPSGVYQVRGAAVQQNLPDWGTAVFRAVFAGGPARDAYLKLRARQGGTLLVFRSEDPALLALPWELMRDPARPTPLALDLAGVSRSLPTQQLADTVPVPGGKLRVLMVIARPAGRTDVGYQMIARPLLDRLHAVRGEVDLVVLRPPTLDQLALTLRRAAEEGAPFHVVHFDGHGLQNDGGFPSRAASDMYQGRPGEGVLVFEKPGGGADEVPASMIAQVLKDAKVPVVVLNACQSGAIGKALEAAVATRLLQEGTASVVAMAYPVYAIAAAEFMAAFYEALFAGQPVSAAVTAGRKRMARNNLRPSRKGDLPLDDWVIPVHYVRRDVSFPQAVSARPGKESLDALLDEINETSRGGTGELEPVGTFTGRDWLTCQLETSTRVKRVVLLHGPGGTGKTELAKAFGRWWQETGGVERPDWVFFHSFEPGIATFGLDGVVNKIGRAVFSSKFEQLAPADRRAAVERALAEHRMLLIWDNFETVRSMPEPEAVTKPLDEDGCRELRDFLSRIAANGDSAVLITSRSPETWLGEIRRLPVGGLTPPEANEYATTLLADLSIAQGRRHKPVFGELMTWLDGHPLAMRLILPQLETTEPAALLDALRGTVPLPGTSEPASEPDGDRLTSLSASVAYSYAHLSPQTRQLLPVLSLFQGFTCVIHLTLFAMGPVPERFAGVAAPAWKAALVEADSVGLLTRIGDEVFRIHPALPAYLAARWREDAPDQHDEEREASISALAFACGLLAGMLDEGFRSADSAAVLRFIEAYRHTLGGMLRYALDRKMWGPAGAIIRPLESFLAMRGFGDEADAWADQVLLATENADGLPADTGEGLLELWIFAIGGQARREIGRQQLGSAERKYLRILTVLENEPKRHDLAVVYHYLGRIAKDRARLGQAEEWFRKSLAIGEEIQDRQTRAVNAHQLGIVVQRRGELDEAEAWYRKALALARELEDRQQEALTLGQLGNVALERGLPASAEDWFRQSITINERLGNKPDLSHAYYGLGNVALAQDKFDEAERWYRASLALAEELRSRTGVARAYYQLGLVETRRDRRPDAEEWYRKALAIGREAGDAVVLASSLRALATFAEERDEPRHALALLVEGAAQFEEFPHPLAGLVPEELRRFAHGLGMDVLREEWRKVTGNELPQQVREYVERGGDDG
ncbi:MAG TPA: tetratricopeptide repeat protein [Streptosporangiaceae bacterium]|nr:tetratricopeptide repeat protein [Streptosporangiaceae bacterium]